MLKTVDVKSTLSKEEYAKSKEALQKGLFLLQQRIREKKLPVIIVFEGWGAAGKGSRISELIANWDPRGYKVHSIVAADETPQRFPPLRRYWQKIPQKGEIAIFDRSWYYDAYDMTISKKERAAILDDISVFERQLVDNDYLILKFFLHITKSEQKKRFNELLANKDTAWRITKDDLNNNKNYKKRFDIFDFVLEKSCTDHAPWYAINAVDKRFCRTELAKTVLAVIDMAIQNKQTPQPALLINSFELLPPQTFDAVDLKTTLPADEYKNRIGAAQKRLAELHNILYRKKIPAIIAFEGWDGAGKGGTIKRLSRGLDARGCEVIPIAAPLPYEKNRHHLWRFWNALPKTGHITVFDRTWYGRCMVERIEEFCTETEWKRSYNEINEFEEYLVRQGCCMIKFWIHIDKDEQLRRFNDRENTPEKKWKITDEDWRNRKKWKLYKTAAEEMFMQTSTDFAPWTIVAGNDKNSARVQVAETVIQAIEKRLKKENCDTMVTKISLGSL